MDEEFVERRPGDLEVYRRLDAFAQLRLAPDAVAMVRVRNALVAHATEVANAQLAAATIRVVQVAPRSAGRRRIPRGRAGRAAAALLAASLTLGVAVGSVAAAKPGGPLYSPRLWVETLLLPGAPDARAEAQVARLDERLAEVRAALAGGDPGATNAALGAYASILADLEAQAVADPAVADQVLDDVQRHLAVLQALVGHVPPQAQDALRLALARSDAALDHIGGVGPGNPNPGAGNGAGRPGNGTGGGGHGRPAGNPGHIPNPNQGTSGPDTTAAPKPIATSRPTKAPAGPPATPRVAEPSRKPATSPAAGPTERPGRTPPGTSGSKRAS